MLTKTFRNTLVASSLLMGSSLLVSLPALAQVSDGDTVGGTVQAVNTIDFVPTATTQAITGGAAVTDFSMGTLSIQNNDPDGWTLNVQSANAGKLMFNTNQIAYTGLEIGAIAGATPAAVTLSTANTDEEILNAVYDVDVADGVTGVTVTADIASGQFVPAGLYTDTLTFTLTSK